MPAIALLLGELSHTGKLFESLFLLWTYIVMNLPALMLSGFAGAGAYAVITIAALALFWFKKNASKIVLGRASS